MQSISLLIPFYQHKYIFIDYIYSIILSWNIIEKTIWPRGDLNPRSWMPDGLEPSMSVD